MSTAALPDPPLDHPDQDAAYFRAINLRMIAVGAELVEALVKPETAETTPLKERAEIYERTTRSVRRGILIAQKIADDIARPRQRIVHARQQIQRTVEDAIHQHEPDPARAETFRLELLERLEDPGLEADILARAPHEIALEIRHDFALGELARLRFHKRRTPNDIAQLRANAANLPSH